MSITLLITIITALVSIQCFNNPALKNKLANYPYQVKREKEYHRWISSGFVHGDWLHLIINMFVFFQFGQILESKFVSEEYFGSTFGPAIYLLFYILAIVASDLIYYAKNKDNPYKMSVGASGAVSAVMFALMMFEPWNTLYLYGIVPIYYIVAGILYLAYETYSHNKNRAGDRINHLAHIFGAVFGIVALFALKPTKIPEYFENIINMPAFF